jgi:hypothetical protein
MPRPTGPPPKPNEQKRRLGNPGRRPLPDQSKLVAMPSAAVAGTPEPLRPLGPPGQALWDRVWAAGARWISPHTDVELLQVLCEQVDERAQLRVAVLRDGGWRERKALRTLDHQVVTALSLLGLTPADRTRLGVAEVQAQSTLDKLRQNRG